MNAETVDLIRFLQGAILNETDLESMCWKDDHHDRTIFSYGMELRKDRKSWISLFSECGDY